MSVKKGRFCRKIKLKKKYQHCYYYMHGFKYNIKKRVTKKNNLYVVHSS